MAHGSRTTATSRRRDIRLFKRMRDSGIAEVVAHLGSLQEVVEPLHVGLEIFIPVLDELIEPSHRRHPARLLAARSGTTVNDVWQPSGLLVSCHRQSVVAANDDAEPEWP
ncbi:hypothetical protein MTO96_012673 [Rhipicephalus appendiculatus]